MGCGKPSKIVHTSSPAATDKQQPVPVPRPASLHQQPTGTRRSSIPVLVTKPRSGPPSNGTSPGTENNSLKENKTPPKSPAGSLPSAGPKHVGARPTSRVSNGKASGGGFSSPTGSVSSRKLKVQKRPRSRGTGDLLNSCGASVGNGVDISKTLLQERDMNGGNGGTGTGDVSNNSTLSAGSSKPLLAASRKVVKVPKVTGGGARGEGGKNSNPSLTSKPASLELVVVVDPEVEGKTRIPRPRQAYQLVDPRRYIRVAHSCEELRGGANGSGRSMSAAQTSTRKVSKVVPGQQPEAAVRPRATRPQIQQRPRSMMLLGSPEAKAIGVESWATGRGAGGVVTA